MFAPIVLGLFAGAAASLPKKDGSAIPAAPLGGVGGILLILGGALAGGGANSARGVDHVLGCSITGWVLYGLSIAYTVLEFAIGFGLEQGAPPAAVVGVGGAMGFTSIVLLSIDGLVVASRAHEILDSAQAERESPRLSLYPVLAPVKNGSQTVGLTGGVGLVF